MMQKQSRLIKCLRQFLRREEGTSTLEFALMMPVTVAVFFASVEAGIMTLRKTFLDRALEMTVRELRLGQINNPTIADLQTRICNRMTLVNNCTAHLTVELNVRSTAINTISLPSLTAACVNRNTQIAPVVTYQPGVANDLVLVRACLIENIIFPTTALTMAVGAPINNMHQLISTTAYVNEPD